MAGFFSTLFGGVAEKEAANKNRALLAQYGQTGNAALDTGLSQSTGAVNTGAGNAAGLLGQNTGLYQNLGQLGTGYLDSGLQKQLGALNQAGQAYEPLSALASKYGGGTDMYLNSLGVNGAGGNQAAVDAFQAGPGYEFAQSQGLDAINRQRAATGMAGNATNIANMYGADTAARLGLQQGVTAGQAGVNTNLANNQVALGNSLAGLYSGDATNRVGLQGNITSGGMSANNTQAAGEAAGAKNLLGAGMNLASLGAGMPAGT